MSSLHIIRQILVIINFSTIHKKINLPKFSPECVKITVYIQYYKYHQLRYVRSLFLSLGIASFSQNRVIIVSLYAAAGQFLEIIIGCCRIKAETCCYASSYS